MQTINNYFLRRATIVYFLALFSCFILYSNHWMAWYWTFAGIIEVTAFYLLSSYFDKLWRQELVSFEWHLFSLSLLIRLLWIIGYYLFTTNVWHTPWEQPPGTPIDSNVYFNIALWLREMIQNKDISPFMLFLSEQLDDAGYPVFLGLLSFLTNNSVFLTRIPNAVFDAWTAVLTYRLAKRNFGERVARISSLFVVLMPMMIFYTGTTMKESLMLMLATWALERGDYTIRNRSFIGFSFFGFVLLSSSLLFFRTALAWVVFLSFFSALVFSSKRVITKSRRVLISIIIIIGGFTMGGAIMNQSEHLSEQMESTGANFEYRASKQGGNVLVKNLSKAMLAPLIFTIPFPTMVSIEGQNIQMLQNGGFFIKNILSFFVIFAFFIIIKRKAWGDNIMIIAYLIGYLIVLTLSSFAHSGRFHHPIIPVEMIFASLGMSFINNKRHVDWFDLFLFFEFIAIIAWNGFKLKGRGL